MILLQVLEVPGHLARLVLHVFPLPPAYLWDPWVQGCPSCQQTHQVLEGPLFLENQAHHSSHSLLAILFLQEVQWVLVTPVIQ